MSTTDSERLTSDEAVDLLASLTTHSYTRPEWVACLESKFSQIRGLELDAAPGLLSFALVGSGYGAQWQRVHTVQTVIEHLSRIAKGSDAVKVNDRWVSLMIKDEALYIIRHSEEYGTGACHFGVEIAFTQARFHSTGNADCTVYCEDGVISCLKRSLGISGNWRDVSIQYIEKQIYRIALGLQVKGRE